MNNELPNIPEIFQERDVLGAEDDEMGMQIGAIGWEGDGASDFYDVGEPSNDGSVLVHVQLFRGRDISKPKKEGVAQGHRVIAVMPGGSFRVPPRGTECLLGYPKGSSYPYIISLLDRVKQQPVFGNVKEGDACFSGGGTSQARVITKANGAVVVMTTDDNTPNGHSIYLRIDSTQLKFVAPWGCILFDYSGFHVRAGSAKFDLGQLGGSAFSALGSSTYATVSAATITMSGVCQLGKPTIPDTYYTAAMYPLDAPLPSGLIPFPLTPPMAPLIFLSPTVRFAV